MTEKKKRSPAEVLESIKEMGEQDFMEDLLAAKDDEVDDVLKAWGHDPKHLDDETRALIKEVRARRGADKDVEPE
jgi:hypothetical protein